MIESAGFMAAPIPPERPKYGTAPIRCGRMRCKWRGFETLLAEKKVGELTINHKVKATGFQPVSFSLAASLGFDEQAICEDAAFPTRGA